MALIQCYECSREISEKAPACPHCGAPATEQPTQVEEVEILESVAVEEEPAPIIQETVSASSTEPESAVTKEEPFNSYVAFAIGGLVFQIARSLGLNFGALTVVFLLVPWALLVRYGKKQSPQVYALIIGALIVVMGIAIAAGPGDVFIPQSVESRTTSGEAAAPAESPVEAATAGNIVGTVTFSGTPPMMSEISMGSEPRCASKYSTTPMQEGFVSGENGGLANVFVYVKEGLESLSFPTPTAAVVLNQDGCMYRPHVLGAQVGQDITLRNSDGLLHNINASPTENRGFNVSQPVNMETLRSFPVAEVMVQVRCDVHGWMNSYIGIVDHPYFAVSGSDGSVSLDGLPPGGYVIEAWHEQLGTMTSNVTVTTGGTADISFEFR